MKIVLDQDREQRAGIRFVRSCRWSHSKVVGNFLPFKKNPNWRGIPKLQGRGALESGVGGLPENNTMPKNVSQDLPNSVECLAEISSSAMGTHASQNSFACISRSVAIFLPSFSSII